MIELNTTVETTFHFNSQEHPGCRIFCSLANIDDVDIFVEKEKMKTVEHDPVAKWEEIRSVRIFGTIFSKDLFNQFSSFTGKNQTHPISIEIWAYNVLEDRDYILKIKDIWLVNMEDGRKLDFSAVNLLPWRPNIKTNPILVAKEKIHAVPLAI